MGLRLPPGHPVFDFFDTEALVAVSAKTLNTLTPGRIANPRQIGYALNRYIRQAAEYGRTTIGTTAVSNIPYTRVIQLAVPSGTTVDQWAILNQKIAYAASQGVTLVITVVR